jgi:hypothetical protein
MICVMWKQPVGIWISAGAQIPNSPSAFCPDGLVQQQEAVLRLFKLTVSHRPIVVNGQNHIKTSSKLKADLRFQQKFV